MPDRNGDKKTVFDIQKHRQALKKNKTVVILLVSLLALVLSVALYFIVSSIVNPKTKEYVLELTYDVDDNASYSYFKDKIAAVNSQGIKIYGTDGLVQFTYDRHFSEPVLCAGEKLLLAYDSGGHNLCVTDGAAVCFEKTYDGTILKAKVASDGDLIVITTAESYKALVTVYDRRFNEIYRWFSSSEFVADADVSEDGKTLAVASYVGENARIVSGISYFNLSETQRIGRIDGMGGLPFSVDFKNNMSVHLVTSEGLYGAEDMTGANALYLFDSTYLRFFGSDRGDITVLAVNRNIAGAYSDLLLFSENSLYKLINITSEIRKVKVSEKYIGVLTSEYAVIYDKNGEEFSKTKTGGAAKDIIVSDSGDMIVFDLEKVTLVK